MRITLSVELIPEKVIVAVKSSLPLPSLNVTVYDCDDIPENVPVCIITVSPLIDIVAEVLTPPIYSVPYIEVVNLDLNKSYGLVYTVFMLHDIS